MRVDSNRAALRSRVSNPSCGRLLSPRVWRIGMSTVTASPAGKNSRGQNSNGSLPRLSRERLCRNTQAFFFCKFEMFHLQGWIRTATTTTAASGRNREELLGQRSDFSRPRQGAVEKSANATRKAGSVYRYL